MRLTALYSFTGMLTSPKLIDPLQMALGMTLEFVPEHRLRMRDPARPGEDGPGHEVGAEGGEDGQVEQAGGGHDRRVVALLEGQPG